MPHSDSLEIQDEEQTQTAAQSISDAFDILQEFAVMKGYCPACFCVALAHAILMINGKDGFQHTEGLKGVGVDFIGKTEGNA